MTNLFFLKPVVRGLTPETPLGYATVVQPLHQNLLKKLQHDWTIFVGVNVYHLVLQYIAVSDSRVNFRLLYRPRTATGGTYISAVRKRRLESCANIATSLELRPTFLPLALRICYSSRV